LGILVEEFQRLLGAVVPIAIGRPRIAAHALQVSLQQSSDIGLVHLWSRRRWTLRDRLVGCKRRKLLGIFLRRALCLLDLKLGVCNCLTFSFLDLLSRGFCLLLRKVDLMPGFIKFLFCLLGELTSRFFEVLFGLLGELLLGFSGLPRTLFFKLLAKSAFVRVCCAAASLAFCARARFAYKPVT